MGNMPQAVELALRQAALGNPAGLRQAAHYQLLTGDTDAAAANLARADELEGNNPEFTQALIATARDPEALPGLETVIAEGRSGWNDYDLRYSLLALKLFELLERHMEHTSFGLGLSSIPTMVWNDEFSEFRRSDFFSRWTTVVGATAAWAELGPPPDCRREDEGYLCGFGFEARAD